MRKRVAFERRESMMQATCMATHVYLLCCALAASAPARLHS